MDDLFTTEQLEEMRKQRGDENFGKEEFITLENFYEINPPLKIVGNYSIMMEVNKLQVKATQKLGVQFNTGHVKWVITTESGIILEANQTQAGGLRRKLDDQYLDELLATYRKWNTV